jgi:hypothetical protein
MALGYRYQMIFKHPAGYGWTEDISSFYAPFTTFSGILPPLINARLALLSNDCEFTVVRASNGSYRNPNEYQVSVPGTPNGLADGPVAQDFTRILLSTETAAGYGRIFMGGIPQSWVSGDALIWPPAAQKAFLAYAALLTSGTVNWGNNSVNTGAKKQTYAMTGLSPSSPRGYTFTSGSLLLTVGQVIRVTGSTVFGYNGTKTVTAVQSDTLPQVCTVGGGAPSNPGANGDTVLFTLQSGSYQSFTGIRPVGITHRKSGRPFGVRPGRQRNRVPLRR